ncbi:unnamed protein product, partial [Allacma fusca]
DDWVSDSGATQHFCGDESWFIDWNKTSPTSVVNADNGKSKSAGRGTVEVEAEVNNKWVRAKLYNVIYVPGGANLFSEGIMAEKLGYSILRKNGMTYFTGSDGAKGPVANYRECGLYFMRFRRTQQTQKVCALAAKTVNSNLLHRRLAHVNIQHIQDSIRKGAVDGISKTDVQSSFKCEECQVGKQARKPFPRKTTVRECNPGEILHVDLAGPMPKESLGGAKYFLLFKDHSSGFRYAEFLRSKRETNQSIKKFV